MGRDPETVRRWIRSGKLRSRKVGTQHLIDEADLSWFEDEESLPLPDEWRLTREGKLQPNWVRLVRESRESH